MRGATSPSMQSVVAAAIAVATMPTGTTMSEPLMSAKNTCETGSPSSSRLASPIVGSSNTSRRTIAATTPPARMSSATGAYRRRSRHSSTAAEPTICPLVRRAANGRIVRGVHRVRRAISTMTATIASNDDTNSHGVSNQ